MQVSKKTYTSVNVSVYSFESSKKKKNACYVYVVIITVEVSQGIYKAFWNLTSLLLSKARIAENKRIQVSRTSAAKSVHFLSCISRKQMNGASDLDPTSLALKTGSLGQTEGFSVK